MTDEQSAVLEVSYKLGCLTMYDTYGNPTYKVYAFGENVIHGSRGYDLLTWCGCKIRASYCIKESPGAIVTCENCLKVAVASGCVR